MTVQRLSDLNLHDYVGGPFTASPAAWEAQVLYFLLLDRFSDGQEAGYRDNDGNPVAGGTTPMFQSADAGTALTSGADAARWRAAGTEWLGGSLAGLQPKSATSSAWVLPPSGSARCSSRSASRPATTATAPRASWTSTPLWDRSRPAGVG